MTLTYWERVAALNWAMDLPLLPILWPVVLLASRRHDTFEVVLQAILEDRLKPRHLWPFGKKVKGGES